MKRMIFVGFLLISGTMAWAQSITLEDIWKHYKYFPKQIPGFQATADGLHYLQVEDGKLNKYAFKSQTLVSGIDLAGQEISSYEITEDESNILFSANEEQIYRYSFTADYKVLNVKTGKVTPLSSKGAQKYATFSPTGKQIAYVIDNNLYYKDLDSGKEYEVTTGGAPNEIIYGGSDWVYEEEFTLVRAFEWNADAGKLAYYKFDEREVPQFEMAVFAGQLYPQDYVFKYPKVGEPNSKVSISVYDVKTAKTVAVEIPGAYEYIPRIKWTKDPNQLVVFTMNRLQNNLKIFLVDAGTGKASLLLEETSSTYIEIHDYLTFLDKNSGFIWLSEKDGYNHIYHYGMDGKLIKQITSGKWDVKEFYGLDPKTGLIYYASAEISPLEKHLYSIKTDGSGKTQLTQGKGCHEIGFATGLKYYVDTYSSAGTPYKISLHDQKGKELKVLLDNQGLKNTLATLNIAQPSFIKVPNGNGDTLNGWMIKPVNFSEQQKYPVLMYVYGGPGHQTVLDNWGGPNYMWFQMLAQKGYIVVSVDNRGTGSRGRDFRTCTYEQLGKLETEDQVASAKYLGTLPYIDGSRIGIFGWSYGGYMSSLCITKGADVFKAAIAVAPVTNWKFYDNIYTERYMGTVESNPKGYDANAPISFADKLKGKYLLIHGTADDNVHWQNTAEMINALVKANKQFDLFIYPDRNHGIYGGTTRLHLYKQMTDFITENL